VGVDEPITNLDVTGIALVEALMRVIWIKAA